MENKTVKTKNKEKFKVKVKAKIKISDTSGYIIFSTC